MHDDAVVAYEPAANHGGDGMKMLFADGHVDFDNTGDAAEIIAKDQAQRSNPSTKP